MVVGGRATGVTTGGCLSVLTTSVGTTSFGGTGGGLVLLEDVDEKAYRLDSYLTHLRRSGWFDGATGIVLGSWADCEPAEPVVVDVLGDLGVPILGELGFGHGPDPITGAARCGRRARCRCRHAHAGAAGARLNQPLRTLLSATRPTVAE